MKLKILFFPAAILAILVTLIWFVWPLYGEIQDQKVVARQKQDQLGAVELRKKAVEGMGAEMDRASSASDFLFRFVPKNPDEEYIINAVDKAAVDSGVGLAMVDARRVDSTSSKAFFRDKTAAALQVVQTPDPTQPVAPIVEVVKPPLQEFTVSATVLGSYDNTKKFLDAMHRIDRLHGVVKASIKKYDPQDAANTVVVKDAAPDLVLTSLTMSFAYVADAVIPHGAAGEVFTRSMDMAFVQSMQARYTSAPTLDLSGAGQSNPFGN